MDDLRSEIRAAFEKEQAAHPVPGGLRSNLSGAAATQSRPPRNLQWIAAAVAAVMAVLVVAGLMSTRLGPKSSVPATTPRATPAADYGPPPVGVQLLYVHDSNNPSWLIGFDWSGQPRGTVKLTPEVAQDPSAVKMSPDGSGFEVGGTYKGGGGPFLDRLGHPVVTESGPTGRVGAMWADDSQHQCVLTLSSTYVWRLETQLPGKALRPGAVIARDPGIGQSGIRLAACSFKNDVAIAMRTVIAWPAELWVVRLSDSTVLAHHTLSAVGRLSSVVASPDGIYVAESSAQGQSLDSPDVNQGATSTVIRRVSDWQVVKKLDPSVQITRFSGDGALVLVYYSLPQSGHLSALKILNWSTGSTLWQRDLADPAAFAIAAQPNGRDFALADITLGGPDLKATISIVHRDGSVTKLVQSYEAAW
ncbi:MAG: hypothetical protein ABI959_13785 [Candidatus Dormiibacterota bacterium]